MIGTIRGRQVVVFSILLLGLLAAGLLGISSLKGLSSDIDDGMTQVRRVSQIGTALQRDVLELIFAAEGYLASGNRESKRRFADLAGRTHDVAKRYRELGGLSPDDAQRIERVTASLTQLEVEYARAHALYDIGRKAEARGVADAAHPMAEEIAKVIAALGARETRVLEASGIALQSRAQERADYVLGIVVMAFLLAAALAFVTLRSIGRPLTELVTAADRLGSGQLRTRVNSGAMPKELATVGAAFNTMAGGLSEIAEQVVSTASQLSSSAADFSAISEQVAASAHEVSRAVYEISEGAEGQARALGETAAAVAGLRDGATQLESQANQNRELSRSIRREADQSQESVRQAVDLLLALRTVVHDTASEIEGLAAATDQITGFVKRITSIAEQTHLLSLNAAIEAAHAGPEGRGFGVVAEEVRKLASEADTAAQEVEDVVTELRRIVAGSVERMQEGEGQVVQVEGVARGAEGALDTISAGLERISQATDEALQTVRLSRGLLDQVGRHVETVTATANAHAARSQDVSASVQEQTATTQQISASVAELVSAADSLRKLVGEWQL